MPHGNTRVLARVQNTRAMVQAILLVSCMGTWGVVFGTWVLTAWVYFCFDGNGKDSPGLESAHRAGSLKEDQSCLFCHVVKASRST